MAERVVLTGVAFDGMTMDLLADIMEECINNPPKSGSTLQRYDGLDASS